MSACTASYVVGTDGVDAGADSQAKLADATVVDAADAANDTSDGGGPPLDAAADRSDADADAGLNCPVARIECNGKCIACAVDPSLSDSQNRAAVCGADGGCATACKPTATLCSPAGDAGTAATCVNLATDPQACGSCTQRCGLGKASAVVGQCTAGKCVPAAIASPSSAESALIVSSANVMLFHKDNQVHSCTLPGCANAGSLTNSTLYTSASSPNSIAVAASSPLAFYLASEPADAGANVVFIARCSIGGCVSPTKHSMRGALGITGDAAGLYLADATGALQQIDIGTGAPTTITTATTGISQPVLTATHIYFYQMGSGIYRCPRTGTCTAAEKVVSTSGMVNTPYDVVGDTLFYAENPDSDSGTTASRILSCSVATTPASCDATKVKQLASGLPAVAAVTADAKAVYFTNKGVSVCTDLVKGCDPAQLAGYVTADAAHSGSVRVVGEFVYWVQANVDTSINVMRAHVPY